MTICRLSLHVLVKVAVFSFQIRSDFNGIFVAAWENALQTLNFIKHTQKYFLTIPGETVLILV